MTNCAICLDPISKHWGVVTPCGHAFHKKCWEEVLANDQNATCSICNGEVQRFQRVYGVDLAPGRGDDGGSDEGTKGLLEKASCYVKRCGKFVNLSKGDWLTIVNPPAVDEVDGAEEKPSFVKRVLGGLTILDLVIFVQIWLAIFSLASWSWGFATINLASNIPAVIMQTLLKSAAESIVEFLLMYFCAFIFVGLLIISWM